MRWLGEFALSPEVARRDVLARDLSSPCASAHLIARLQWSGEISSVLKFRSPECVGGSDRCDSAVRGLNLLEVAAERLQCVTFVVDF